VLRAINRTADRLPALLTGSVDAAVLTVTDYVKAKEQGCHTLLFYGDDLEFIAGGVVVNNETLSKREDFVRRFLRATLKSFQWFKTNEKGAAALLRQYTKLSPADAVTVHKILVPIYSQDGTVPRSFQERMITRQMANLKIEKKTTPEMVYDFSILDSLNREMGK
jgi:ABC-type nitrate/sulfonate/bicarbonate transport system substrate-binding protein